MGAVLIAEQRTVPTPPPGFEIIEPGGQTTTLQPPPGFELQRPRRRAEQRRREPDEPGFEVPSVERGLFAGQIDPRGFVPSPTLSEVAERAGVGTEGASAAVRFDLNLATGAIETPRQELDVAKRALERDVGKPVEVRVGPETGQLEFRPEGGASFNLVNAPGLDFGDIAAATPEAGAIAVETGGAIAGGAAGAGAGPVGAGLGVVAGEALTGALTEAGRLFEAKRRGLIDLSNIDIIEEAAERGGINALGAGTAGLALRTFRRLAAGLFGLDPQTVVAAGGREAVERGAREARPVQAEVEAATGRRFPITVGQAAESEEALRAEQRAMTFREEGAPLRGIRREQEEALGELERRTFGPQATPEEVRRAGREVQAGTAAAQRRATAPGAERVRTAEERAAVTEREALAPARQPESAVAAARERLAAARERTFEPFRRQFDELQTETGIDVNLKPFRKAVTDFQQRERQTILPSISLQEQSRLLGEAGRAGVERRQVRQKILPESVNDLFRTGLPRERTRAVAKRPTLGEVQRALQDIRRELRRPGLGDEPQRRRLVAKMENELQEARDAALSEADPTGEALASVLRLERQFARQSETFDRGVIGQFTETDRFGKAVVSGEDALNRLVRDTDSAEQFVKSTGQIEDGERILLDAQEGVLGLIERRFIDPDTGRLAEGPLKTFLRTNRESLERLFANRPDMVRKLKDARKAAQAVKRQQRRLDEVRRRFESRFGFANTDPNALVANLFRAGNAENFRVARRVLKKFAPQRADLFDKAVAREARDRISGAQGRITADNIRTFLNAPEGQLSVEVLGDRYRRSLNTLRDALRIAERKAPPSAPRDLGSVFSRGVPTLQGLARFLRVVFPPLSPRGRGLTAALGVASEETRRKVAEALADPDKLAELARLSDVTVGSEISEKILGNLGFKTFLALRDFERRNPQGRREAPGEDAAARRRGPSLNVGPIGP